MKIIFYISVSLLLSCSSTRRVISIDTAKPTLLKQHVEALVADEKFRNHLDTQELNRVAKYIKDEMENIGLACHYQTFYAKYIEESVYKNVVCVLQNNQEKNFIIGAHYDVCGFQEGADDNASGVAGLIEAARLLHSKKKELKHNFEFVAYTLEEPPFYDTKSMGSYIHASSKTKEELKQIQGMISLEMIGFFTEKEIQEYPAGLGLFYPSHGNFIAAVSNFGSKWISNQFESAMDNTNKLDVQILVGPAFIPGVDFSDHRNYWTFGIDGIMITDTAFNRNKNYHQTTDLIQTLNFEKMAHVVNGVVQMFL